MMQKLRLVLCLLTFVVLTNSTQAQNYEIKGVLVDSTGTGLESATAVLLQASDSLMTAFTVSNSQGSFRFLDLNTGKYIVQISYMGYKNWAKAVELKEGRNVLDLGNINLDAHDKSLEEVEVIGDKIPIIIKKDTIEYNADAFKVKPNADVEALLKKLPGVEVDKDGTVKAQGEEVKKILVDGKEFFGDDPKTATKNLPADAIKKVQVLDRLSEMSQFTGVDDGNREKTINLTLKEEKKNGTFGKITAGAGTEERYRTKANINKFNKKMQFSLIGAGNNINERNVSFRDYISFSGGIEAMMENQGNNGGGFRSLMRGSELFNNRQGINTNWTGGMNFNYDFSDKTEFHLSYLYNNSKNILNSTTNRQNFSGSDIFLTQANEGATSTNQNHTVRTRLEHKINEKQDLILKANLGYTDRNGNSNEFSQTFVEEGILRNEANVNNNSIGNGIDLSSSLIYRFRLAKKGRTFSLQGDFGLGDNVQDERLISNNIVFRNTVENNPTNQLQNSNNDRINYAVSANYTEPVGKRGLLQVNYKRSFFRNEVGRDFFDINDTEERILSDSLSTAYNTDYVYDKGGLSFVVNTKKSNLTWGLDLQNSNLDGEIISNQVDINRDFLNLLPRFQWRFDIASGKSLRLNYNTAVNEPSLDQLQPIVDNSNPLRLYRGNPDLKVAYQHSLRLGYFHFDQFSFTNIFANFTARYTQNQITNQTIINDDFTQEVRPINVDNDVNVSGFASFGMPIRPLKIKFDLRGNTTLARSILFVNAQENIVRRYINSLDLELENRNKDIVDIAIGGRLAFNQTEYSENTELNQDFLTQTLYSTLDIDFLERWHFSTEFDYDIYAGDAFQQNQEVPIWKASVSVNFLKFNKGELELSVFDILNQNQGIQRNSQFNFIEEQQTNVLGRYFMFSFTYSLNALGRVNEKGRR